MTDNGLLPYGEILLRLKEKIKAAQQKAILTVNSELLYVYWEIGNAIAGQEQNAGWGGRTVDKLAADLKAEFPSVKGFSPRNLRYMRDFALAYPRFLQQPVAKLQLVDNDANTILQQAIAKLTWSQHLLILTKVKVAEERIFYIKKTIENGWSRNVLQHQVESGLYKAHGALVNNFSNTLPAYQSELTQQVFKDPYNFDFIMLGEQAKERDLENALMNHVTKVLLELGAGFAFMGRQKRFEAGGRDFFIDLLFYHTKLRRHIVIELKIGEFEPEYVSKMNLYLGLADDQLRGEYDEPAIGIILCKTNNRVVAEYALRDTSKPIGIAEYKIAERLPEDIKGELPSIEEIEQRVDEEIKEAASPTDARLESIKERIKSLHTDEIQTPVTFKLLSRLYAGDLKPLYTELMDKINVFKEDFYSISYQWYTNNKTYTELEQVDLFWEIEENLESIFDFNFRVRLEGFKKGGAKQYNAIHTLRFGIDTFHYYFMLEGYNNQQPFLEKLYTQPLVPADRIKIIDTMMNRIMDNIERFLKQMTDEN